MKFLTARWENLLLANYSVPQSVLTPFVPAGTQLDAFNGTTFVSLVAFMFNRTRVLGVPIPFHTSFEEVNLRFYVSPIKNPERRAVTFLREIVPRSAIPLIANTLFGENYVAMNMGHESNGKLHRYSWKNEVDNWFSGRADRDLSLPISGSVEEFITEHYWGYSKAPVGTIEYKVEHPQWRCCKIEEYGISVDFGKTYGERFAFLSNENPICVQFAEGSEVSVSFPKRV